METAVPRSVYIRGVRRHLGDVIAFPAYFWTCPSHDTSARQGEPRYVYHARRHLRVLPAQHILPFVARLYAAHEVAWRDCFGFAHGLGNRTIEERVLTKLAAVADECGVDGVYRMQGDGPVYIWFGRSVHDAFHVSDLMCASEARQDASLSAIRSIRRASSDVPHPSPRST